jgi:hypothetical protein
MISFFGRALLNEEGIAGSLALASRVDVPGRPFECLSQVEELVESEKSEQGSLRLRTG